MSKVLRLGLGDQLEHAVLTIPVSNTSAGEPDVSEVEPEAMAVVLPSPEEVLEEARQQAAAMVEGARQEAARLLADAEAESRRMREQAHQEGFEAGVAAGRAAVEAELAQYRAEQTRLAESIVADAQTVRMRMLNGFHEPLTKVCMEAVRTLLRRELTLKPVDIERIVSEALQTALDSSSVEVRVHPDDYRAAVACHPQWQSIKFGEWEIAIVPDAGLSPGGCEVRYDGGRADASLEAKLEILESTIRTALERSVTSDV